MDSKKRDLIDNEILRLQIQKHPNFSAWYGSLPPHARQVFDILIEEDATPELIELAQQSPEDDWDKIQFLRVIGGGNLDPEVALALTNITLYDIMYAVENQNRPEG